ncbi:MAG: cation diffusion facilitator family transporter [Planctomycetaceae bacterium]
MPDRTENSQEKWEAAFRSAQMGVLVNAALAAVKLVAGFVGNSYALVADAVESTADIFSSLVVLGGLRVATRTPTDEFPFGFARAETMSAVVVSLMLVGTSIGIAVEAIREIRIPHHAPAPWTLAVLCIVIVVKWTVSRKVQAVGENLGSRAVQADAWHHLSDAVTSVAAFIGIGLALWMGPGWEPADDWAALLASAIIMLNGVLMLKNGVFDLLDRSAEPAVVSRVRAVASGVPGVEQIEKLVMRRAGPQYFVDIHVQADPAMSLRSSHDLGGAVKWAILSAIPSVAGVLVHMEPFESSKGTGTQTPE